MDKYEVHVRYVARREDRVVVEYDPNDGNGENERRLRDALAAKNTTATAFEIVQIEDEVWGV